MQNRLENGFGFVSRPGAARSAALRRDQPNRDPALRSVAELRRSAAQCGRDEQLADSPFSFWAQLPPKDVVRLRGGNSHIFLRRPSRKVSQFVIPSAPRRPLGFM